MPANCRGIEKDVRAEEARDARGLGIPLVPADQHANRGVLRLPHAKAARLFRYLADDVDAVVVRRVARREIVLLVEERIVRNVHLAIHAEERAVCVYDRGGVAIDAASLLLEDGYDE